jgi:hypothetical protein
MKKIIIALLIVGSNILLAEPVNLDESATIALHKQIDAIPKRTIKAHSRTPEENRRHQKICAQQGLVDVTDENDVTVGIGSDDPIVCISGDPSGVLPSAPTATAGSLKKDSENK